MVHSAMISIAFWIQSVAIIILASSLDDTNKPFDSVNATELLINYVYNEPNPYYEFFDTNHSFHGVGIINEDTPPIPYTAYVLNMTSGMYLNSSIISRPLWWHFLVLIIPSNINKTQNITSAFLWTASANSGSNDDYDKYPTEVTDDMLIASYFACHMKLPTIVIFTNPNQPIRWFDDPTNSNRKNNALLCYTLHEGVVNSQLPMYYATSRSSVLALDTIQTYINKKMNKEISTKYPNINKLNTFGIGGASKYGWIVWLHSAIDNRVISHVSVVYDLINWIKNLHHQYQSLGGWTWAMQDCWDLGLMAQLDSIGQQNLMNLIDVMSFKDDYKNKKIMVTNNGRDEFFLPDDTYYWWDNITSNQMYYLFVPNTDHSGVTGLLEILPAVATWVKYSLLPEIPILLDWSLYHDNYTIVAKTNVLPTEVNVWYAPSCRDCNDRRDWRSMNLDLKDCPSHIIISHEWCYNTHSIYKSINITADYVHNEMDGMYYYNYTLNESIIADDKSAYILFFLDFRYNKIDYEWPIDEYDEFELSTQAMIINDTFPYPDCSGVACNGTLV